MNNQSARVKIISETSVDAMESSLGCFLRSIEDREPSISFSILPGREERGVTIFPTVFHAMVVYREL